MNSLEVLRQVTEVDLNVMAMARGNHIWLRSTVRKSQEESGSGPMLAPAVQQQTVTAGKCAFCLRFSRFVGGAQPERS